MRRLRRSPSGARNLGVRSLRLDFVDFLFETQSRNNENLVRPGDALLAEDDIGSGHTWRMLDYQPWLRAYVSIGDKKTLNQTPRWVGTRSAEGLQAATRPTDSGDHAWCKHQKGHESNDVVEPRGQIHRRGKRPACRQSGRDSCGGARALPGGGKRLERPRWSRMRAEAFRSVMNATTLIPAPQRAQRRISISKTRLSSAAQSSLEARRMDEALVVGPPSGRCS